jgi:hypothetical protein
MNIVAASTQGEKMSGQIPRPIGTIAFASALLASALVGVPANMAFAVDCLSSPNLPVAPNTHWYYRTDRTQHKCWHLQTDNGSSELGAVQTPRELPAKPSQSIAGAAPYAGPHFKEFAAQHGGAKLSDEDVEKLYAEFLEWKQRKN